MAPVRSLPNDKSEMISQLLFGETAEVVERRDNWTQVVCSWDGYSGWVDTKQLKLISASDFESYNGEQSINLSLVEGLMAADYFLPLTMGAVLPRFDGLRCRLGEISYQFSGHVINPKKSNISPDWIAKLARKYLHAPYLWGGRSPFGIDCSGFTQMVYKFAGIRLLRDASQQVTQGKSVDFMEQCELGDLAFFDNGKGQIGHVGIIIQDCHIIHASGKVRIDKLDHFGIFNKEQNRYTHQLRIVKRLIPEAAVSQDSPVDKSMDALNNQTALFS